MQATRKLIIFLKPYWQWVVLAPLLMALEVGMDLMQPRLLQTIIDDGIGQSRLDVVYRSGALMVLFAVIGLVGGAGCTIYAVKAAQGLGADLRDALFAKIQTLSFGNLDKLETGRLVTRLTNDVTQVQEVVMLVLRIMVRAPLMLVGSLVMGILTSPTLALLFLALIPTVLIGLILIIRRAFPLFSIVQARLDTLNTVMQENLAGVRLVKAFVRGEHETRRFGHANEALTKQNITAVRTVAVTMPFMMLLLNAGIVATVWYGGAQVKVGGLQVGQIVAFMNYLLQTLMSLMMVSMLATRVSRAEASAVRIDEVLSSTPEIQNRPGAQSLSALRGRVAFENVSFGYKGHAGDLVLKNVSFVVEPGQTVALLGATGSGKSSLVNLIPRFYDVTGGRVTLDGVDVRDLDQADLRRQVAVVLQESVLFSGTIRDNIRYGRPDAPDAEVIAAAKLAQAHGFISAVAEGYDAEVGQRGVNLSGGQKQRLAIARGLLVQPSILILDDSTSAVDVETEAKIQDGLAQTRRGRTSFIVAQRISTVLSADKILVLDDGQIVAEGSHAELLDASPIYREIYMSQMENGRMMQDALPPAARPAGTLQELQEGVNHG